MYLWSNSQVLILAERSTVVPFLGVVVSTYHRTHSVQHVPQRSSLLGGVRCMGQGEIHGGSGQY